MTENPMSHIDNPLRQLPQVQRLLERTAAQSLCERFGRAAVTDAIRQTLETLRERINARELSDVPDMDAILTDVDTLLTSRQQRGLRRTINATGIVLHTNLGRAPLAPEAIAAVAEVASAYCNLEFDLATGRRGSRTQSLEPLLRDLTR
jgi:L-seryl-tRNA(Ser) seleniumtransferase